MFTDCLITPAGVLHIHANKEAVTRIRITDKAGEVHPSPLLLHAKNQLQQWFANPSFILDFPISFNQSGTPLQQKIWGGLQTIPAGTTRTYQQLAEETGTGPRVIGNACRLNPLPFIIPCHRVVAKKHCGGFAGHVTGKMIEIKQWLLDREQTLTEKIYEL